MPISTWRYIWETEDTKHIGPMAQDFKEKTGLGDGKTIAVVDVMGLLMQSMKQLIKRIDLIEQKVG